MVNIYLNSFFKNNIVEEYLKFLQALTQAFKKKHENLGIVNK